MSVITQCLVHCAGRKDAIPDPFLQLTESLSSTEEPFGTGQLRRKVAQQSNFHQMTKPCLDNFELNVTKFHWMVKLNSFQPPAALESQEKNDSIHRRLRAGSSLYLWDRAALWGSVTLRWSWRHGSEEQAQHVKDPQTNPGGTLTP